jgi:TRAP-type mannitol/chloroaromatic compound transport system substrate-binding protein
LTNYESSSKEFASKLTDKSKQIETLRQEVLQLKDKSDLDRATAARNKLMATIKQRDEQIKNLSKAIDTFKDKMIEYEGKELDHHEENIILEKKDRLEIKRLKDELEQEVKLKKKAIETKTS